MAFLLTYRRSSSIVRSPRKARKSATEDRKCHMSWLSKKSPNLENIQVYIKKSIS